jgi:hypothetical protein
MVNRSSGLLKPQANERRAAQRKFFSEVKLHRLGDYFRAQTRHIAERLQTRPSLFIGDRLQYEPDAVLSLEEKKAEVYTLVAHQSGFIPSGENCPCGSIFPSDRQGLAHGPNYWPRNSRI